MCLRLVRSSAPLTNRCGTTLTKTIVPSEIINVVHIVVVCGRREEVFRFRRVRLRVYEGSAPLAYRCGPKFFGTISTFTSSTLYVLLLFLVGGRTYLCSGVCGCDCTATTGSLINFKDTPKRGSCGFSGFRIKYRGQSPT